MNGFPRTTVGGISVSRMIIGTNWFLGFSHATQAKDEYLVDQIKDAHKIADIIVEFLGAGVDTLMACLTGQPVIMDAIKEAEDRTGKGVIIMSTPGFPLTPTGIDFDEAAKILDVEAAAGARFLMPHTSTTDVLVDRLSETIRSMEMLCRMIRERNMIPGLSTHMPESIRFADKTGLDVETYISIYNAMGFLMPLEVDWTAQVIRNARKPVVTIKPMAAGHIRPFQAFNFVWNTIRDCDMVCVGTMSPKEATECIELSLGILERRSPEMKLQETRSKSLIK